MRNPNPTTAKRQLNAFYVRQGLRGRDRHRAVRADMKLVREYSGESFDAAQKFGMGIESMFIFALAPQGPEYWAARTFHVNGGLR